MHYYDGVRVPFHVPGISIWYIPRVGDVGQQVEGVISSVGLAENNAAFVPFSRGATTSSLYRGFWADEVRIYQLIFDVTHVEIDPLHDYGRLKYGARDLLLPQPGAWEGWMLSR